MTPTKVSIVYSAHHEDHLPGDRVDVAPDLAKRLVRAGKATYATKDGADKADGGAGDKTGRAQATKT